MPIVVFQRHRHAMLYTLFHKIHNVAMPYIHLSVFLVNRFVTLAILPPTLGLKTFGSDPEAQQKAYERYASKHTKC